MSEDSPPTSHASPNRAPQRVLVVGTAAAGKSTLARHLARCWELPHVDVDALRWRPGGGRQAGFVAAVAAATAGDRWVADGYSHDVEAYTVGRAELVVWLDLPLAVCVSRLVRRTLVRRLWGFQPWKSEREHLRRAGPLAFHAVVRRGAHRRRLSALADNEVGPSLVRLRTVGEVTAWVDGITRSV